MTIPIASPQISDAAREAVADVLDSGMLADGEEVRAFEREFADYVGTEHAVATVNGTAALHAMLVAGGIGEGDAVVTTPFTFIATANAIRHAGAEPVFGDIDPRTFNLDPDAVRRILDERNDIAAILPVHLYGLPFAADEFNDLASEYDLLLFEDAAQAHGATFHGEMIGSLGAAATFSFYPTKNMTTSEGGMVTTDDPELAGRIRRFIDHGRDERGRHAVVGYNYRMTNMQAAIGRDQLERLPEWVQKRRQHAAQMSECFDGLPGIEPPIEPDHRKHAYHQYTVKVQDRSALTTALDTAGVGYGIYYPETIPGEVAYGQRTGWPVAEEQTARVLSLPVHQHLDSGDIQTIVHRVEGAVRG